MTRDELQKRLVRVKGQPLFNRAAPMESGRRGQNHVETESDYEGEEFDNFFDFEEDLADMEMARRQVERIEMDRIKYMEQNPEELIEPKIENEEEIESSYFVMDEPEEDSGPSGDENSFFIFDV
jgi:hypothetical protein